MTQLRLSLIQTDLQWQSAAQNRHLLQQQLMPLAGLTDLILLPEMFTSAFSTNAGAVAEDYPGHTLLWMQNMAQAVDAAITGSIAVTVDGKRYNRLLFVKPDGSVEHYDKRHLFRMLGEDKRYMGGCKKLLVQWRGWRILPLVCYDLRFPVWCRYTNTEPYDLLLFVSNWPAARNQHWRTLLQARAIENLAWVAGVNRVGTDGNNLDYFGHSAVINPQGTEIMQATTTPGVFNSSISMQELQIWREKFPAWMDADEFDLKLN